MKSQKITPFLWFDGKAGEAMDFYTSVFRDSRIVRKDTLTGPYGEFLIGTFTINGQEFRAIDGGPQFTFSPAISFVVKCRDQAEIDFLWEKLSEGGEKQQCGWLRDKFGVSWQIVPEILDELFGRDAATSKRVMDELLKMTRLDVGKLKKAYENRMG